MLLLSSESLQSSPQISNLQLDYHSKSNYWNHRYLQRHNPCRYPPLVSLPSLSPSTTTIATIVSAVHHYSRHHRHRHPPLLSSPHITAIHPYCRHHLPQMWMNLPVAVVPPSAIVLLRVPGALFAPLSLSASTCSQDSFKSLSPEQSLSTANLCWFWAHTMKQYEMLPYRLLWNALTNATKRFPEEGQKDTWGGRRSAYESVKRKGGGVLVARSLVFYSWHNNIHFLPVNTRKMKELACTSVMTSVTTNHSGW